MSRHEHDEQLRGAEPLRERLERDIAATPPDFADVLARVRARDDRNFLPADLDAAESTDDGVDAEIEPEDAGDELLAPACAVLRERIEAELAEADLRPLPTPRQPSRVGTWIGVALALAAVLAGFALLGPRISARLNADASNSMSVDEQQGRADSQTAQVREPAARRVETRERAVEQPVAVEPEPEPPVEAELEAEPGPEPEASKPKPKPKLPLVERLAQLDAKAQARWQAGDTAGAKKLYLELVRIGGKHRKVELAFAELFALARQRKEPIAPLWRRYLGRFPQGRYAREAKGGLCRQASGAERDACWAEYTLQFGEP